MSGKRTETQAAGKTSHENENQRSPTTDWELMVALAHSGESSWRWQEQKQTENQLGRRKTQAEPDLGAKTQNQREKIGQRRQALLAPKIGDTVTTGF
jgi:hypothetical protein